MMTPQVNSQFLWALGLNMVWVNTSEIIRYFGLIKPMLHDTFPMQNSIALVTPGIFLSWMVWDTILILACTGFYWLFLDKFGYTKKNALISASYFTLTVFGLLWLGVINMGLAPTKFIYSALPFAWAEQIIAALIVYGCLRRRLS